jgi:hypothetical protein
MSAQAREVKRSSFVNHVVFVGVSLAVLASLRIGAQLSGKFQASKTTFDSPQEAKRSAANTTTENDLLLLSVPFYVYEELAWVSATYSGIPVGNYAKEPRSSKHSDDYWFMQASLRHPMRTRNPEDAKLFVAPILMNFFDRRVSGKHGKNLCWKGKCNRKLLKYAGDFLNSSPWFQTSPHLHIAVISHFAYMKPWWLPKKPDVLTNALYQCHAVTFEGRKPNAPDRLAFPNYYVGNSCPLAPIKSHDLAMIANMEADSSSRNGHFQDRRDICTWIKEANGSTSVCGSGNQCPALAQAKFGFHARGDTFGSNRLMDTILSGTVPLFTREEQYDILPSWIDWKLLSYFVATGNTTNKREFLQSLESVLQDKEGYKRRQEDILQNRKLFDWMTLHPFDTYMYMLQAEIYPETRHASSPWSALILPPLAKSSAGRNQ